MVHALLSVSEVPLHNQAETWTPEENGSRGGLNVSCDASVCALRASLAHPGDHIFVGQDSWDAVKNAPGACCRSAMMVPLDSRACTLAQQCCGFGKRVYGGCPAAPQSPTTALPGPRICMQIPMDQHQRRQHAPGASLDTSQPSCPRDAWSLSRVQRKTQRAG